MTNLCELIDVDRRESSDQIINFSSANRLSINIADSEDILSIEIIVPRTHLAIPIALESVAAGFPSPANDYIDKCVDLNEYLVQNKDATFMVRIGSLSMIGAGLDIGDKAVVDRSLEARHGDIIIALVYGTKYTVKRLILDEGRPYLKSENPDYPNIYFDTEEELVVWGVVTSVVKKFR
ncbi:LexA family protein [Acinetobacter ursingii]|uniref:LexA family protein n=1 Tax=Acinetobacter ursingii TaxID=108980 RepID=UPI00370A8A23